MKKIYTKRISFIVALCLVILIFNFQIVNASEDSAVFAVGETFYTQPVYSDKNKNHLIEYLEAETPVSIYKYENGFCYIGYRKDNEVRHGWMEQRYICQFNIPLYKTIYLVNKANGCTVTSYLDDPGNPLYCNSKIFQEWEQLQIIPGDDGYVALKFISTNKFASVRIDQNNAPVRAEVDHFIEWESIFMEPVYYYGDEYTEKWYTLTSRANGNYIASNPNEWANALVANQSYFNDYVVFGIDYNH